jgi:hypothetical protein
MAVQGHVIFTCQMADRHGRSRGHRFAEARAIVSSPQCERAPTRRPRQMYLIPSRESWSEHFDEAGHHPTLLCRTADYDYRCPDSRLIRHPADSALRAQQSHGMCCF